MNFFIVKIHIKELPLLLVWLAIAFFNFNNVNAQITKSEIQRTNEGYRLFLNGEPFYIKGAGLHNGDMDALAQHGANAVRTWSTDNGKEVLDKAHQLGLKVMMGIWVGHERHGFDYNDKKAVKAQLERIRERVLALKDHPALIVWGVGNEMNLQSRNPKVWDAVNEIAEMIHEVDPNHLTTSPLAGIDKEDIELIAQRAPEIDFLSVQLYGPMDILPQLILESEYKGPLLITEWGATGYWEVEKTPWGAPLENDSSKKADLYLKRYQKSILGQSQQIMGSFVFLWGQKQERTPTWFGMFMPDGKETESVDAMHFAWNGIWPKNRSPRLQDLTLAGKRASDNVQLTGDGHYLAEVKAIDPDKDELIYHWEIMRESQSTKTGGDAEYVPESLKGLFLETKDGSATFKVPSSPGPYRLFVYVEDGHSHVAHANIPFWVSK
nr:glycoside hydrolase family 2 TIM barrel-domain containing protein [Allomuricauda sp.]